MRQRLTLFILSLALVFIGFGLLMSSVDIGVRHRLFENLLLSAQAFLLHAAGLLYLFEMIRKEQTYGLFVLPLTSPIKRSHYLVGRFIGVCLVTVGLLILFILLDIGLLFWITQTIPMQFIWQLALLGASSLLCMAILMLLTTLTAPTSAMIYTIIAWFIGNGLDELLLYAEKSLSPMAIQATQFLYYVWPNFSFFDQTDHVANHVPLTLQQLTFPIWYSIFYISLLLWLSTVIYQRKPLYPMAE